MKAQRDDQLHPVDRTGGYPAVTIVLALLALAGLLLFWYFGDEPQPEPVATPPQAQVMPGEVKSAQTVPPAPDIPRKPVSAPAADSVAEAMTEPAVAQAPALTAKQREEAFLQQLSEAGVTALLPQLKQTDRPLDISAALLDAASRGNMLRKLLPAQAPSEPFAVVRQDDGLYIDPASYERYDAYTDTLTSLDTRTLAGTFHTLRPFLEGTFKTLGLDPDDVDNAVMRTLDLILATPAIQAPVEVEQKSVMYEYADPALETLPEIQKQLLRTGPENLGKIKQQARQLRGELLSE